MCGCCNDLRLRVSELEGELDEESRSLELATHELNEMRLELDQLRALKAKIKDLIGDLAIA